MLRARIPRPILVFGTSLLNAGRRRGTPEATALAHDLDGVRFVDMPWLLEDERADGRRWAAAGHADAGRTSRGSMRSARTRTWSRSAGAPARPASRSRE